MKIWEFRRCFSVPAFLIALAVAAPLRAQKIVVDSADPSSAEQGTQNLDVTIKGRHFAPGSVAEFFVTGTPNPGGITVNATAFVDSRTVVANIDISDTAVVDQFDIAVSVNGRTGKGIEKFGVIKKAGGQLESAGGTVLVYDQAPGIGGDGRLVQLFDNALVDYADNRTFAAGLAVDAAPPNSSQQQCTRIIPASPNDTVVGDLSSGSDLRTFFKFNSPGGEDCSLDTLRSPDRWRFVNLYVPSGCDADLNTPCDFNSSGVSQAVEGTYVWFSIDDLYSISPSAPTTGSFETFVPVIFEGEPAEEVIVPGQPCINCDLIEGDRDVQNAALGRFRFEYDDIVVSCAEGADPDFCNHAPDVRIAESQSGLATVYRLEVRKGKSTKWVLKGTILMPFRFEYRRLFQ